MDLDEISVNQFLGYLKECVEVTEEDYYANYAHYEELARLARDVRVKIESIMRGGSNEH